MLFLEQAHGRPTWSLRATWCPRAPRWWPLCYRTLYLRSTMTHSLWMELGCC